MDGMTLDTQLCQQCRGRCCQGHPGVWSDPQRFFSLFTASRIPSATELSQVLQQQKIVLRDLGGILVPAPQEDENGCRAWKQEGCSYPTTTRPCQCLALVPNLDTLLDDQIHCCLPPEFGSNSARRNWQPWQKLLRLACTTSQGPQQR